ncbi:MAG TPA: hypothetical protein VFZ66_19395 [Herpetosiphonaceae bacterium]
MRSTRHTSDRATQAMLAAVLLGLWIILDAPPTASKPTAIAAEASGTFISTTTPSRTFVVPGESITVEVRVLNETADRCFGLPQFRLYAETAPGVPQDVGSPIFTPAEPQPVTLYTSIAPGGSASAPFILTAARPGSVTFFATVSGESTSASCQPPYFWSAATPSRSAEVVVATTASYLPIVTGGALAAQP